MVISRTKNADDWWRLQKNFIFPLLESVVNMGVVFDIDRTDDSAGDYQRVRTILLLIVFFSLSIISRSFYYFICIVKIFPKNNQNGKLKRKLQKVSFNNKKCRYINIQIVCHIYLFPNYFILKQGGWIVFLAVIFIYFCLYLCTSIHVRMTLF